MQHTIVTPPEKESCLYGYGGRKELSGADWTVQAPSQLLSCVMGIPADGGQQQTDLTRS